MAHGFEENKKTNRQDAKDAKREEERSGEKGSETRRVFIRR
jgi:hypothetical protein